MTKEIKIKDEKVFQHWKTHIKEWEESKKSKYAYCKTNKLNRATFNYWLKKIKSQDCNFKFVEISSIDTNSQESFLEIIIKDSIKIKVSENYNSKIFLRLLKVKEGLLLILH